MSTTFEKYGPQAKEGVRSHFNQQEEFLFKNRERYDAVAKTGRSYRSLNWIPIQDAKKQRINAAINTINDILAPQIASMTLDSTKAQISERMRKKVNHHVQDLNVCWKYVRNVSNANDCSDELITALEGPCIDYAKQLAAEY